LPDPLKSPEDVSKLNFDVDCTEKMKGTLEAITLTRHKLEGKVPLLGFTGAPVFNGEYFHPYVGWDRSCKRFY
jgi:uroporphyrinogen-III decarboxylase